jgi:hypothetical protein
MTSAEVRHLGVRNAEPIAIATHRRAADSLIDATKEV